MTLFTKIIQGDIPSFKIYEDDLLYAFLDAFPSTKGHLLIVPKQETESVLTASPEIICAANVLAQRLALVMMDKLGASGVNILTNANEVSGQTVAHYHVHVIPRYTKEELQFVHSTDQNDKKGVQEILLEALK